jgi:branched-chain amino acid transport system substrate-binding protein
MEWKSVTDLESAGDVVNSRSVRRTCSVLAIVGAVSLIAAACGSSDHSTSTPTTGSARATGKPYKVSIVGDATGGNGYNSALLGIQTGFQAINDAGGVDGHPLELTVSDAQSTTTGAQTAIRQALATNPDIISAATVTTSLAALVPTLQQADVPVVSNPTVPTLVTPGSTQPWFFGMGSYQPQVAMGYIEFLKQQFGSLQGKRIATVPSGGVGAAAVIKAFTAIAKQQGAIIVRNEVTPLSGFTSFASQAANIVADKADIVVTVNLSAGLAIIDPALRTAGFTGDIIGGEGSADDALFNKLADPMYFAGLPYSTPQAGDAISAAAKKYGHDSSGSLFSSGWAQAYVVAAGLKACGFPCKPSVFIAGMESLKSIKIPGDPTFAPVSFGPDKHFALSAYQFEVWDSAQKKIVPVGAPVDVSDLSSVPSS